MTERLAFASVNIYFIRSEGNNFQHFGWCEAKLTVATLQSFSFGKQRPDGNFLNLRNLTKQMRHLKQKGSGKKQRAILFGVLEQAVE